MNYQKLSDHMQNEHGLILLESEIFEIINLCKPLIEGETIITPTYETNKYSSFKEAFEGGVTQAMRANNMISVDALDELINSHERNHDYEIATEELRIIINKEATP